MATISKVASLGSKDLLVVRCRQQWSRVIEWFVTGGADHRLEEGASSRLMLGSMAKSRRWQTSCASWETSWPMAPRPRRCRRGRSLVYARALLQGEGVEGEGEAGGVAIPSSVNSRQEAKAIGLGIWRLKFGLNPGAGAGLAESEALVVGIDVQSDGVALQIVAHLERTFP